MTHEQIFRRVQWLKNEKKKLWVESFPQDIPNSVLVDFRIQWGSELTDEELTYAWKSFYVSAKP